MSGLGPPNSISARSSETRFLWSARQTESINFNYLNIPRSCNRGLLDGWLKDSRSPLNGTSSSLPHVMPKPSEDAVGDAEATLPSWGLTLTPVTEEPLLDLECKIETEKKPKSSGCYRLFGIDLVSPSIGISSTALSGDRACISGATTEDPVAATALTEDSDEQSGVSKDLKEAKRVVLQASSKEIQSKQNIAARSCTKMFEIKGELQCRDKWEVVFTDDEGDMMLVGDYPWLTQLCREFCEVARKILIYPSEDVKRVEPENKLPATSST
ncbi:hypothetical protein BHE74_00059857 [Ensete ventricosum]|nr:hypothetical protein GW17_00008462 [Ensete ventricosum]RWW35237.1 hypothetical protein BHE74_00059857 [Ensete ventricosum]RZS27261.1 hypothetical protein BHM03_00060704 [Ensete ventricosum]